ncbi:MAG: lipocalin family protein [Melioribacteraceae bacterium]|nr:lipocalin family protein [Melioribacteraceae bacterium]MCF8357044.1 lipocalin family protein [Melioribacteraceae bacterium]MCF8396481.1 lipocalin family protein [Melioribacteraceae bacterium]
MNTIKKFLPVFGIIIMLISGCSSGNYPPLDVVDSVDVQKYLGKWYEIARLPNSFQDDCYRSTAEYELIDSSTLRVINSCNEDSIDGEIDQVTGKAFIVENTNNAKLKVQFFWPFKGDYWIIALDQQDYSYALVGTPSRKYLWLLARDKDFGGEVFDNLIKIAAAKGFDTSKLIIRDEPVNP